MTKLERRMQHKRLQGLCTKNSQWYSQTFKLSSCYCFLDVNKLLWNWRNDYVKRTWFQVCFESRKCPG